MKDWGTSQMANSKYSRNRFHFHDSMATNFVNILFQSLVKSLHHTIYLEVVDGGPDWVDV